MTFRRRFDSYCSVSDLLQARRAIDLYDPKVPKPDWDDFDDLAKCSLELSRYLAAHLGKFTNKTADEILQETRVANETAEALLGFTKHSPTVALNCLQAGTLVDVDIEVLVLSARDLNGLLIGLVAEIDSFDDMDVVLDRLRTSIDAAIP